MANIKLKDIEGFEAFKEECDYFYCEIEYPGWTGTEKYGIITELNEIQLEEKYPAVIALMRPFILLNSSLKEIRNDYRRNEKKHAWRNAATIDYYDINDHDFEEFHPELVCDTFNEEFENKIKNEILHRALTKLTDSQRRRIKAYYFDGKTIEEIAKEENVVVSSVHEGITAGLKKLKKILKTPENFTSPIGNE